MPTLGVKIRAIVPKEIFNLPAVQRELSHIMTTKTPRELRKELERTVRTWNDKPIFRSEHYMGIQVMWVKVYTYSIKYRLVNAGARPHPIYPRRTGFLRFQTGYRRKSRPKFVGSFVGGKFGPYISTKGVPLHPGHEAREFDITIAEDYAPIFQEDVQEAIKEGIVHR